MVVVVILCGVHPDNGELPKQLIKLPNDQYNLFEQTLLRTQQLVQPCTQLIIVSHLSVKQAVMDSLNQTQISIPVTLIWEPWTKNTGPAIGCVIKYIQTCRCGSSDPTYLIFPSDHILSIEAFNRSLASIDQLIESHIVAFGVYPKYPETEYGYILEGNDHTIKQFIEKPSYQVAKQLIRDPYCYWNSGIYAAKMSLLIAEYQQVSSVIAPISISSVEQDQQQRTHITIDSLTYQTCPNIPFDKLIMEMTSNGCIVPLRGLWSDIGSWETIYQASQQYKSHDCHKLETHNCHLFNYNQGKMVALVGVEDLCVINTPDAVLISKLSATNQVRQLAQLLEDQHVRSDHRSKYADINVSVLFMIILFNLRMEQSEGSREHQD